MSDRLDGKRRLYENKGTNEGRRGKVKCGCTGGEIVERVICED